MTAEQDNEVYDPKSRIVVVPYDPEWPEIAKLEKKRIQATIGKLVRSIDHVGSTSVPGLGGKPRIDFDVAMKKGVDINDTVEPMVKIGYEYIDKYEDELPFRRLFTRGPRSRPGFNIHVVPDGHQFRREHFLFRNYMRKHSDKAEEYYRLKLQAARENPRDIEAYCDHKDEFIKDILAKAEEEGIEDSR